MSNCGCYVNWFLSAGLLRITFHNYNNYLFMGTSAFLPPFPLKTGLHLLQGPVSLDRLGSELTGSRTEHSASAWGLGTLLASPHSDTQSSRVFTAS